MNAGAFWAVVDELIDLLACSPEEAIAIVETELARIGVCFREVEKK